MPPVPDVADECGNFILDDLCWAQGPLRAAPIICRRPARLALADTAAGLMRSLSSRLPVRETAGP